MLTKFLSGGEREKPCVTLSEFIHRAGERENILRDPK